MQIKKIWKFITAGALIGAIAIGGAACSSTSAQTAPAAPAANVQAATNLILNSDMVIGSGGTVKVSSSCVLASQYQRGNQVVFRVRVYDPATGKQLDDKALSSVTIALPDGQTFTAKYGGHPAKTPVDSFWATSWVIPDNYPTGTLNYTATAKATDGRTGTFDNFNVQPSLLTVIQ
jgi:hypothetical protein